MVSKYLPASQSYPRAFVELINRFACESFLLCPYCFISETLQNPGSVSFSSRCLIFKVHLPNFLATLLTRRSVLDYNIKSRFLCQWFFQKNFEKIEKIAPFLNWKGFHMTVARFTRLGLREFCAKSQIGKSTGFLKGDRLRFSRRFRRKRILRICSPKPLRFQ